MKCNSFSANFISAKSPLIQGKILVPTPNITNMVSNPHQRKLQRTEEKLITLFIEQMHHDTMTFKIK